jgi:hypothetical protein
MQPSNPRSEMSSNQTPAPSGNGKGANVPNGKGNAPNNQPEYTPRPARSEVKKQQQQQTQQTDEPRRLSLAELFSQNDDGEISNEDENVGDDPSKPPETMEALSKRLGFKPEQIYNVKIPLADGAEPLTIGQLKDRIGELVDLETRETQFEQRRMRSEGELLRSQAEIREILQQIPREHIKPEVVNKIRQRHEANMARERQMTLEHIPEWRDEKRASEDLQGMIDLLGEYGFDETFIGSVHDHRAIKFIRDMYLRDKRIKAALAKVTTPENKGQRGSAKTGKAAARPNKQTSTRRSGVMPDQRSRIAALFND